MWRFIDSVSDWTSRAGFWNESFGSNSLKWRGGQRGDFLGGQGGDFLVQSESEVTGMDDVKVIEPEVLHGDMHRLGGPRRFG